MKNDWIVKKVFKRKKYVKNLKNLKNRVSWGKGDMKWKFKRKKWHERVRVKIVVKIRKMLKKNVEKIGKNQKKLEKIEKKIRKNYWKIINSNCIYVYVIYCQYLVKVGRSDMTKMKRWQEAEDRKVL